jgi:hypothetical protein
VNMRRGRFLPWPVSTYRKAPEATWPCSVLIEQRSRAAASRDVRRSMDMVYHLGSEPSAILFFALLCVKLPDMLARCPLMFAYVRQCSPMFADVRRCLLMCACSRRLALPSQKFFARVEKVRAQLAAKSGRETRRRDSARRPAVGKRQAEITRPCARAVSSRTAGAQAIAAARDPSPRASAARRLGNGVLRALRWDAIRARRNPTVRT